MMTGRDEQRSRVYAWEDEMVVPRDPSLIAYGAAQGMVDAIWSELGLRYPPRVEPLPKQATTRMADGSRLTLRLPAQTPSWCLLHELAHALTSTHDGHSDQHGPVFAGIYVQLLVRYLRLPQPWLLATLESADVQVDMRAQPLFVDTAAFQAQL
ncbi:SprT-like domain-containing protein [Lichenicola cladoniae]|nr:SprT-like domain-containing protein [Lichenicola cladoniae]